MDWYLRVLKKYAVFEGRARRKDARKLDAMAAKIILENWLQSLSPENPDHP